MKKQFALLLLAVLACVVALPLTVARMDRVAPGAKPNPIPSKPAQQKAPKVTGQLIETPRQDPELAAAFQDFDLIRLDPVAAAQQVRESGVLVVNTSRGKFNMKVSPHDMRSPDYEAQVVTAEGVVKLPRGPITTYKGKISEDETAQVRMTVKEDSIEGAILTDQGRLFLQPARAISKKARADEFVFYKSSDVKQEAGTCGVTLAEEVAAREDVTPMVEEGTALPKKVSEKKLFDRISPMKLIRLATDADGEYFTKLGSAPNVNAKIQEIMNLVEGTYELELGLTFDIVFQNVWDNATTDPYTTDVPGQSAPGANDGLLREFRNRWEQTGVGVNPNFKEGVAATRTMAHLWTGRDLQGNTIGIAFTGVTCRVPDFAYGLSQQFPFGSTVIVTASTVVLTAHEMGHNFSAGHTNQPDEFIPADIEIPCDNTIMEAAVGDGANFCPFSRSQIIGFATAFGSCLDNEANPAPPNTCVETAILTNGAPVNGELQTSDCRSPSRGASHYADRYTFNANAGQQIVITYNDTSGTLDPYLYLIGPDGQVIAQDDDSNCGLNSRIPFFGGCNAAPTGNFTLPMTGKYIVEATSYDSDELGAYTVAATFASCTLTATAPTQLFGAAGGAGTVNVTATGAGCGIYNFTRFPSDASGDWITPAVGSDLGTKTLNFTVAANANAFGRKGFLLVGAVDSTTQNTPKVVYGGIRIPITQLGTTAECVVNPIAFGQTINGELQNTDCLSPVRGAGELPNGDPANGMRADRYSFTAIAGQKVSILMSSTQVDAFLTLLGPNGDVILTDDDSGGPGNDPNNTDSRIPGGTGTLTLGLPGTYIIEAGSFGPEDFGAYSLTLNAESTNTTVQFSAAAYNVNEGAGSLTVTVNRTGDTTGTSTVDYRTVDNQAEVRCDNIGTIAFARCDYVTAVGTLSFGAGETSKTFTIPIVDDAFAENSETFDVALTNPTGATVGTPGTATVTITDNDATDGANPIFNTPFFVRQHYLDFLSREPEPGEPWSAVLNNCSDVNNDPTCDRLTVSAAFFGSPEFQLKGYFVYRFYKLAFNRLPTYEEISFDMAAVTGQTAADVFARKAAFTNAFTQRTEFTNLYNALNNQQYVEALMGRYNLAQITTPDPANPDGTQKVTRTTQQLIDDLGTLTRAQVLRMIADSDQVFNLEFNQAFVAMQYFGYLRRAPEQAGFDSWLNFLNANPTDFRTMVNGFMNSIEYRLRFGPQ